MQKTDKDKLLFFIESLLVGALTVHQFYELYYLFQVEANDNSMTSLEENFFSAVREKLDWVGVNPSIEDRRYGYINHQEYIMWLRKQYHRFKNSLGVDWP